MVALLADSTYVPGATRTYHPSQDPGVIGWDEFPLPQPDKIITFSGYTWSVKTAEEFKAGPGPNYFSDHEDNVFVETDPIDRV